MAAFNFPVMIPLWMFPPAIVTGNTCLIKPSEQDPGATLLMMELLQEAGAPPGVVSVSLLKLKHNSYINTIMFINQLVTIVSNDH